MLVFGGLKQGDERNQVVHSSSTCPLFVQDRFSKRGLHVGVNSLKTSHVTGR